MFMLEAILPISDREPVRRNLDRATLALQSLDYFWRDNPLLVHIVVPDAEFAAISGFLTPVIQRMRQLRVNITSEADLSPAFGDFEGRGYQKQMLVKLAAFHLVSAPFLITIDTDVVACRPFGIDDLIVDGKAVNDWIIPTTTVWYIRSLDILGVNLSLDKLRFFVTPQVMSTVVCRRLANFLTRRFEGQDWMYGLMRASTDDGIWSEYALYDLYAEHSGLLDTYHLPPGINRLQSIESGIWYAGDFERWEPERIITGQQEGVFVVLQSITANDLDFDAVRARWLEAVRKSYPGFPSPFR
jgi:hypothetical protein